MEDPNEWVVIDGEIPKEFLMPDYVRIAKFLKSLDQNDHCAWAHLEKRGEHTDGK